MADQAISLPSRNAWETLFQTLPHEARQTLMLGAIPHYLDADLAETLFSDQSQVALATINKFRFVTLDAGHVKYHVLARTYMLNLWQAQAPDRFREVSRKLAVAYHSKLKTDPIAVESWAEEWLYHLVAADPREGLIWAANLFHEYLESKELGNAERLVRLLREQETWLEGYVGWLDYFAYYLEFSLFKTVNPQDLERLALSAAGSVLGGCVLRLLGRVAIREHRWDDGRKTLLQALEIFRQHDSLENQALVHLDLGDLFLDVVESSGGILVEDREFKSGFHAALYYLTRVPLVLYRLLAERINLIPNLYGMNYQNWVGLRILRLALAEYQVAAKEFNELHNWRGVAETRIRCASILLTLSYTKSATTLCQTALKDRVVKTSPYYTAQALKILGQVDLRRGSFALAREQLTTSLETFEAYFDWVWAARSALELSRTYEKLDMPELALQAYERGLLAARNCKDFLIETEIHRRLDRLIHISAGRNAISEKALTLRSGIKRLAYIDRYPGTVSSAFQKLSYGLVYPFLSLFIIAGIVGSGITVQFLEGELRIQGLPPINWLNSFDLLAGILLPLLMVWGYYLLYALLGQIITWRLPFRVVDDAHRDLYILDEHDIHRSGKGLDLMMDWSAVRTLYVDNRAIFDRPLVFSSRAMFYGEFELRIEASVFCYPELIDEIEKKMKIYNPDARVLHQEFSLLRTPWLWIALLTGLMISLSLVGGVFFTPFFGCYQNLQECPEQYRLYVQPIVQYGLFFASVFFMLLCWVRWKIQDHRFASGQSGR